jgi:hypothetical protein
MSGETGPAGTVGDFCVEVRHQLAVRHPADWTAGDDQDEE